MRFVIKTFSKDKKHIAKRSAIFIEISLIKCKITHFFEINVIKNIFFVKNNIYDFDITRIMCNFAVRNIIIFILMNKKLIYSVA